MGEFLGVITETGLVKQAAAMGGTPINATVIRVGDGNGAPITPSRYMTDLVHRVGNGYPITASGRDPANPTVWRFRTVISAAEGPFDIREIGLFDAAGDMLAIARHVLVEKRTPAQGAAVELETDILVPFSETAQIAVTLAPETLVGLQRLLRPGFIAVESMALTAPPANPAPGSTYIVAANPTGVWTGLAGKIVQWNGALWESRTAPVGHLICDASKPTVDPNRYMRKVDTGWVSAAAAPDHFGFVRFATAEEITARAPVAAAVNPSALYGDDGFLSKGSADRVTADDVTTGFQNVLIEAGSAAGVSRKLEFQGKDEAAVGYVLGSIGPGQWAIRRYNTTTGALIDIPFTIDATGRGIMRISRLQEGTDIADITAAGGALEARNSAGGILFKFPLNGTGQFVQRAGALRQIATEDRQILAGTGLTGGGNLGADRTLAFDTAWGDARYATTTRQIIAGTGLSGGGTIGADRTLSFNTTWGDDRYARGGKLVAYGEIRKHLNNGGAAGGIAVIRAMNCTVNVLNDLVAQVTFTTALPGTNYDVRGNHFLSAPALAQNVNGEFDYISTTRTAGPVPFQGVPRQNITAGGFQITFPQLANQTLDEVFSVYYLGA